MYIKKIRSFDKIVKFIDRKRDEGCTKFEILTTETEIIIITSPMPHETVEKETIRINY